MDDLSRSLPTQSVLWFCDSNPHSQCFSCHSYPPSDHLYATSLWLTLYVACMQYTWDIRDVWVHYHTLPGDYWVIHSPLIHCIPFTWIKWAIKQRSKDPFYSEVRKAKIKCPHRNGGCGLHFFKLHRLVEVSLKVQEHLIINMLIYSQAHTELGIL